MLQEMLVRKIPPRNVARRNSCPANHVGVSRALWVRRCAPSRRTTMIGQPNKSAVRPAGSRSFQISKKRCKVLGQVGQWLANAGKHEGNCWKVVPACSERRGRSGTGVWQGSVFRKTFWSFRNSFALQPALQQGLRQLRIWWRQNLLKHGKDRTRRAYARVAKLADALDLGSCALTGVGVRLPPLAVLFHWSPAA